MRQSFSKIRSHEGNWNGRGFVSLLLYTVLWKHHISYPETPCTFDCSEFWIVEAGDRNESACLLFSRLLVVGLLNTYSSVKRYFSCTGHHSLTCVASYLHKLKNISPTLPKNTLRHSDYFSHGVHHWTAHTELSTGEQRGSFSCLYCSVLGPFLHPFSTF